MMPPIQTAMSVPKAMATSHPTISAGSSVRPRPLWCSCRTSISTENATATRHRGQQRQAGEDLPVDEEGQEEEHRADEHHRAEEHDDPDHLHQRPDQIALVPCATGLALEGQGPAGVGQPRGRIR